MCLVFSEFVSGPAMGQDATSIAPTQIGWNKPSAAYADTAGTAQRVDPQTLRRCETGQVLTLHDDGTFACTDTIANASNANHASSANYANSSSNANTVGGKTVEQILAGLHRSCPAKRFGLRGGLYADLPARDSGMTHTVSHSIGGGCEEQWEFLCTSQGAWVNMEENLNCH